VVNRAHLTDESGLASDIFTRVRVNVPDLSPSLTIVDKAQVYAGDVVNVTLSLRNRGALDAAAVLTATLPSDLALLQDSVGASSGDVRVEGGQVRWSGSIGRAGVPVVIAFQVRVSPGYLGGPLPLRVTLDDGYNPPLDRSVTLGATRQLFLPFIERRAQP
jgi:uncharacterized repeat protein (TIGR01451 family)